MLCYDIRFKYAVKTPVTPQADEKTAEEADEKLKQLNASIYARTSDGDFYGVAYNADEDILDFAVSLRPDKTCLSKVCDVIAHTIESTLGANDARMKRAQEITIKQYSVKLDEADNRDYIKRSTRVTVRDLGVDYFDNNTFKVSEEIAPEGVLTKEQALAKASEIMADQSLLDEIERIYSPENSTKFYGFPVHYCIQAGNADTAMPIINLLMRMLRRRNRVIGNRVNIIHDINDGCYDELDFENIIKHSGGAAVAIEMCGIPDNDTPFATGYEAATAYIAKLAGNYRQNTLFFFIEDFEKPGFAKELLAKAQESMDIIDIAEGKGNRDDAVVYLKSLAQKSTFSDLIDDTISEYLPKRQKVYKCHDVHKAFDDWSRDVLRNKAYSAYSKGNIIAKKTGRKKGTAYQELQDMVGLEEVKSVTDQIIASCRMQEIRHQYGSPECGISKHMVFTGNPGSAKTTVARLISDILTDEGALKSGAFVECGRADIVGKYVGWTAKTVRDKFRQAEGGILFIDEAYSLVDGSNTFGDEAINGGPQKCLHFWGEDVWRSGRSL